MTSKFYVCVMLFHIIKRNNQRCKLFKHFINLYNKPLYLLGDLNDVNAPYEKRVVVPFIFIERV